jgi:hypothetical protein
VRVEHAAQHDHAERFEPRRVRARDGRRDVIRCRGIPHRINVDRRDVVRGCPLRRPMVVSSSTGNTGGPVMARRPFVRS